MSINVSAIIPRAEIIQETRIVYWFKLLFPLESLERNTNNKFSLKMVFLKYMIIVLFFTVAPSEERSITVMMPQSDPFFVHKNTSSNDLDVKIINTFAERFGYEVKYIVTNETVSEIFATERAIERIFKKS